MPVLPGRVLSRESEGGKVYVCASCDVTGIGSVRSICACGSKIGTKDAGIRCVANDFRGPLKPHSFIAKEVR